MMKYMVLAMVVVDDDAFGMLRKANKTTRRHSRSQWGQFDGTNLSTSKFRPKLGEFDRNSAEQSVKAATVMSFDRTFPDFGRTFPDFDRTFLISVELSCVFLTRFSPKFGPTARTCASFNRNYCFAGFCYLKLTLSFRGYKYFLLEHF